jgi:hypothetical protein
VNAEHGRHNRIWQDMIWEDGTGYDRIGQENLEEEEVMQHSEKLDETTEGKKRYEEKVIN